MEDLTDNGSTENINKGDLENASGPTGENEETPETTESKAKTVADEDMSWSTSGINPKARSTSMNSWMTAAISKPVLMTLLR